jgi:tetratricopeptide (TPR) repeat protein
MISSWAYDAGHLKTAVAFAHVAARVRPDDPEVAFAVARATRDTGRFGHADAWFQRALGLARRTSNPEMKARVYIGWGLLDELRVDERAAKAKFEKALSTATASSLPSIAAHAHQFMMALTISSGTFEEGFAHAVAAARLYALDDQNLPRLASDTGALFSEHGYYTLAVGLYEAAIPFLTRTADLVACHSNIGRACAALGQKQRFSAAWTEVERLSRFPLAQFYADSLVELAAGALTLRYWKHAAKMVAEARSVAAQLGSVRTLQKAERLAESIEKRQGGDVDRPADPKLEEFSTKLRERLAAMTNAHSTTTAAPG